MFAQLKVLLVFVLYSKLASSLSCYDCPSSSPQPCTKTCTGALSCAYEVRLPLQIINEQTLRCENSVAQQGCVGHLESQSVVCFCTSELCNKNLNTTPTNQPLGIFGQSTPITPIPFGVQPQFGLPAPALPSPALPAPALPAPILPNNGIPPINGQQPINGLPQPINLSTPPPLIGRKRRAVDTETTIASLNRNDTDTPGTASKLALKSSSTTFQIQSVCVISCVIFVFNQLL